MKEALKQSPDRGGLSECEKKKMKKTAEGLDPLLSFTKEILQTKTLTLLTFEEVGYTCITNLFKS